MVRFCVSCGYQFARAADTAELAPPDADHDPVDDTAENDPADSAPPPPNFGQISRPSAETSPLQPSPDTREFSAQDFLLMVVDDTPDNLILISLHLQQAGYRVITASNGEEALRLAEISPPDLILMDIAMPTLDGLGATRQLREHPALKDVRVIALTAFSTDGFRRAAYDAGIDGYLTKPVDFERLTNLIRRLLPTR
jgi:two-component system cell cycle response regulator DivK